MAGRGEFHQINEEKTGLERVGVRGREEPFLKRFSLPRIKFFHTFKWDYYEINKQNTISAGG